MSSDKNTAQAVAAVVSGAIKIANEAKARIKAEAKPASAEMVEKAAQELVTTGWLESPALKDQAIAWLGSHENALQTLINVAQKSAEALGRQNDKLAAGTAVPNDKKASAKDPNHVDLSEADEGFVARMNRYRKN